MLCVSGGGMLMTRALAYASLLLLLRLLLLLLSLSVLAQILASAVSGRSLLLGPSCRIFRLIDLRSKLPKVDDNGCKVATLLRRRGAWVKLCMFEVGRPLP
jgi:hypothetical protein